MRSTAQVIPRTLASIWRCRGRFGHQSLWGLFDRERGFAEFMTVKKQSHGVFTGALKLEGEWDCHLNALTRASRHAGRAALLERTVDTHDNAILAILLADFETEGMLPIGLQPVHQKADRDRHGVVNRELASEDRDPAAAHDVEFVTGDLCTVGEDEIIGFHSAVYLVYNVYSIVEDTLPPVKGAG